MDGDLHLITPHKLPDLISSPLSLLLLCFVETAAQKFQLQLALIASLARFKAAWNLIIPGSCPPGLWAVTLLESQPHLLSRNCSYKVIKNQAIFEQLLNIKLVLYKFGESKNTFYFASIKIEVFHKIEKEGKRGNFTDFIEPMWPELPQI